MIVYYHNDQEKLLAQLKEMHDNSSKISIHNLIIELTKALREKHQYLEKVQVSRDGLLGSLRRIDWAFSYSEKADVTHEGHDEREVAILVFFHNAKCFIEILKKCFPKISSNEKNIKTFHEITTIRNFFAHSYEKDFLEKKTFTRIAINHHFNKGLYELEIFDFDTAEKIHGIYFSLAIFFSEILELTKTLTEHIKEN